MNNIFQKTKLITLDSNWTIEPDGYNGVILIFRETRQKDEVVKVEKITPTGKKYSYEPTGKKVDFVHKDTYYFPRASQALSEYAHRTMNTLDCLDKLVSKTEEVLKVLHKIDESLAYRNSK